MIMPWIALIDTGGQMKKHAIGLILVLIMSQADFAVNHAQAAATGCGQAQVEKLLGAPAPPGASASYIYPRSSVKPFYQWESNNGYCGETSLIMAGLNNGQWMSQYNARLICGAFFGYETNGYGASLEQAGTPLTKNFNQNAQLLIENPKSNVSGPYDFAHASLCGSNARLKMTTYPYTSGYKTANIGINGYKDYMSWIKSRVIAGDQVTIAVLFNGLDDPQYDHEVSVIKIGTNHSPTDPTYYADDVMYFDDHGAYTLIVNSQGVWDFTWNPSVPPGAGSDKSGCTPYVFAYSFGSLGKTRSAANASHAPAYSIVIPSNVATWTIAGNTSSSGTGTVTISGPHNYGFAVSGPADTQAVTKRIIVKILSTKRLVNGLWQSNPWDANSSPNAGNNYESPYIGAAVGSCDMGNCVTNTQPPAMEMTLQATVNSLQTGVAYNLYEYDFPTLTGADTGTAAALAVPTANFNANRGKATHMTSFTATGTTYTTPSLLRTSDQIIVFRAVAASAP